MSTPSGLDPLPRTSRGWITLVGIAVVVVVTYLLVTVFYNAEGGIRAAGGVGMDTKDGVVVILEPSSIDAAKGQSAVQLTFRAQGSAIADGEGRAAQDIRISIEGGDGTSEVRYPVGVSLGEDIVTLAVEGEEAAYPFDTFQGQLFITVDTYKKNSDGSITSTGTIPVGFETKGGINGWDTTIVASEGMTDLGMATFGFNRAFSTQVFALLIIALAVILAVFSLLVGVLVFTGRRPAEVALLGWTAALIFSLPLLRNYMPNAPPFGAAIDVYAYLWTIAAAVTSAVLVILGWLIQKKPVTQQAPSAGSSRPAGQ